MKNNQIKIKRIVYKNNKLYTLNNIDKDKLDENTEFYVGSITKLFTTISLLILHQDNKININNTFKKYLDHKELANVKIIDVINHISGIKNIEDNHDYENGTKEIYNNCIEYYNSIKEEKLIKHKKGTNNYSNLGYLLLGTLIETITDITYKDFVYINILKPLKMNNTGFGKINTKIYKLNMKKLTKFQNNEIYNALSDGGLKTSVSDLIKFKNFHKLLKKKSILLFKKTVFFNYDKKDNIYKILKIGKIQNQSSRLLIKYNTNWVCKEIYINSFQDFI